MDRKHITTILYLTASMLLFLLTFLQENPMYVPLGFFFLVMAGVNSQTERGSGT